MRPLVQVISGDPEKPVFNVNEAGLQVLKRCVLEAEMHMTYRRQNHQAIDYPVKIVSGKIDKFHLALTVVDVGVDPADPTQYEQLEPVADRMNDEVRANVEEARFLGKQPLNSLEQATTGDSPAVEVKRRLAGMINTIEAAGGKPFEVVLCKADADALNGEEYVREGTLWDNLGKEGMTILAIPAKQGARTTVR